MDLDDIPMDIEDDFNSYHPPIKSFRETMLDDIAEEEKSDLVCPKCEAHLPYTAMTCTKIPNGVDSDMHTVYKDANYCTLCEVYFDNRTREVLEV